MRIEGTLAKWNDERGFGFITPTKGGTPELFVHVSAFPRDGQRPSVGELLTFEIETDKDGKKRATNLLFPNRVIRLASRQLEPSGRRGKSSLLGRIVSLAVVVALAIYGYGKYAHRLVAEENVAAPLEAVAVHPNENTRSSVFQCDGRTHCSQMTSCAEATFFLKNCPNVKMDGNHDGVPCEQQWCN
ncbi:cold shock domain-containing protein [Accumulibacter sp.]|uniref:cold shock domain-containing protein n=1 Tax=Accumulibacter sp. TaxID=2053492 RepID=UPI00391A1382